MNMEAKDFVYCGEREGAGRKRLLEVGVIKEDKTLTYMCFAYSRKYSHFAIGCVYKGAEFSETQVKGMERAAYVTAWPNEDEIEVWRIKDEQCRHAMRCYAMEKKVGDRDTIRSKMKGLALTYATLNSVGEREAMERLVLRALRTVW